jgi:hypothetical protein
LQGGGSPTSDCVDSAASRAGRRKGVGGGASGVFIGGGFLAKGARLARSEAMDGSGSSRAGAGLLPEEGDDPDERAPGVSGRRGWGGILSG